jgi:threonine dehydratase
MSLFLPDLDALDAAKDRLAPYSRVTPVLHLEHDPAFIDALGPGSDVTFKLEQLQQSGSFKFRGATLAILGLDSKQRAAGVTAYSAGNHAIAVSLAAQVLGVSAKVIMPRQAMPDRVATVRSLGAEALLDDDLLGAARKLETQEGRICIEPFSAPYVVLGTGTLGLEWVRQAPWLEAVIIAVGGGGLIAGAANAIKRTMPDCAVFGVEPEGADIMRRSFAAGRAIAMPERKTIADSLAPPFTTQDIYEIVKAHVDALVTVSDAELSSAMRLLFRHFRIMVEPAGAAALAALLGPLRRRLGGKRIGLLLCGANIDPTSFMGQIAEV